MGQDNQFMQPFRGTPLNDFGGLPTTAPMYPPTGTQNVAYNQGNDLPVWGPAFGQQQWQIPAPSHAMDAADRMNVYPPPATDATTGSMGTLPYYTDPYCAPGSIYGPYPSLYMPPTSVGASNNPTPAR